MVYFAKQVLKEMKIFQIITVSEYGGAQSFVANLVQNISKNNAVFILYGGEGEAWEHLDVQFTKIRLNKHRKSIGIADIWVFFKLLYYRFKYRPDIVHLHSSKMGVLGRLAFKKKSIVLTMHGFDSVRKQFKKFLIIEKLLKNRASAIVGVSKYDEVAMLEEGITNATYIYNGVEDFTKEKVTLNSKVCNRFETLKLEYSKTIMCISRISQQKRFDLFVEIAKELPEYAFIWIGNKKPIDNLPENVFCMGELSYAMHYLKFCDIFILPSNYEGLPISMLEALCCSKPIVASAVGGVPEILETGCGFAVDNTVNAFKEKITYLLENKIIYDNFSKQARETYLSKFTLNEMVKQYQSLYQEIYNKQK